MSSLLTYDEAVEALTAGLVVAVPTDTLYGLAVSPYVSGATSKLFDAKRRPHDVDLPVLVADAEQASALATTLPHALVAAFWPGALTIVVNRRPGLELDLGSSTATVGLRVPDHDGLRTLCRAVGPLAITSANLHGDPTPPDAEGVAAIFGDEIAGVVDGGPCAGAPSTVVDSTGPEPRLLREGRIAWDHVVAAASE